MKILIIDHSPKILYKILESNKIEYRIEPEITEKNLTKVVAGYDVIVTRGRLNITKAILDKAKKLRFIGNLNAEPLMLNFDYSFKKDLQIFNPVFKNADAVGEHAVAMLLAMFNNLCRANMQVKNGIWKSEANQGILLHGKTVGIIGYGKAGSAFARKLSGFDLKVIAYDKYKSGFEDAYVKESDLEGLFRQTDILSLHIPLTKETYQLIDYQFIRKFEKSIYLINTSHGSIINTNDVAKEIQRGKIIGAALDVLEYENSKYEKLHFGQLPDSLQYLIDSDNVLLTPHIAGKTKETEERMAENLALELVNAINK